MGDNAALRRRRVVTSGVSPETVELIVHAEPPVHDALVARLAAAGFGAFQAGQDCLRAYIAARLWKEDMLEQLPIRNHGHLVRKLPARDYVRDWKDSLQPVYAAPFVVAPAWVEVEPGYVRLTIEPRMSFGTGHHATTRLMLRLLPQVVCRGDRVLDAGTGSGILAIAAAKLGAGVVLAVDSDPGAVLEAEENSRNNGATISVRCTSAGRIVCEPFDVVLANMDGEMIRALFPALAQCVRGGGILLLSGLTAADCDSLLPVSRSFGFEERGQWAQECWRAIALCGRAFVPEE